MSRAFSLIRSALITGLTFAVGVGLLTTLIGVPLWLFGAVSLKGLIGTVLRFSVVSSFIGVVFSGLLAITARGRSIEKLSLLHFTALGAGVGFAYFLLMGFSGAFQAWSLQSAIANFLLVTVTGGGSAAGLLLVARRGRPVLSAGDEGKLLK